MCNRYRMTARRFALLERFGIEGADELDEAQLPPPELFPKRPALVVRQLGGARKLDMMRWGFPPPPGARAPVTNVRNLASPFWRAALASPEHRCLVPASDFCEWEGAAGAKVARWFSVPDQPIFAVAGVWRPTPDGAVFAMLTCDANPLVAAVHPKAMPVILDDDDHETWLTGATAAALALATPFPSQLMAVV